MTYEENQYLVHYGIKGQKHGVRRFQNEDGSLTAEGRERYGHLSDRGDSGFKKWSPLTNEAGFYAFAKWRSRRHNKNLNKWENRKSEKEASGESSEREDKKIAKYESKKAAQDAANANLDAYRRHSSAAKLCMQNYASLTLANFGANSYRHARSRGNSVISSVAESIPVAGLFLRMHRDKKAYGKRIVYSAMAENEYDASAMDRD